MSLLFFMFMLSRLSRGTWIEICLAPLGAGPFPKEQTEKEKALLKNNPILNGLASNFKRGKAVFERNTLKIVEMDVLGNELFHLGARGEAGAV